MNVGGAGYNMGMARMVGLGSVKQNGNNAGGGGGGAAAKAGRSASPSGSRATAPAPALGARQMFQHLTNSMMGKLQPPPNNAPKPASATTMPPDGSLMTYARKGMPKMQPTHAPLPEVKVNPFLKAKIGGKSAGASGGTGGGRK